MMGIIIWKCVDCDIYFVLDSDVPNPKCVARLEEELIDLVTFCLQNPNSIKISNKHKRITEIGHELFVDGGVDALENFFCIEKWDY